MMSRGSFRYSCLNATAGPKRASSGGPKVLKLADLTIRGSLFSLFAQSFVQERCVGRNGGVKLSLLEVFAHPLTKGSHFTRSTGQGERIATA